MLPPSDVENPSTYSENTIDYPDAGGPVNFETNYKKYMRLCYISDVDVVTVPDTQLFSNSSVDHQMNTV